MVDTYAMTRAQLRAAIEENTGRLDKTTTINRALDLALLIASREHTFKKMKAQVETVTLLTGGTSVALPDDTLEVLEAILLNGTLSRPLPIKTKEYVTGLSPKPDVWSPMIPTVAYIENGYLFFASPSNIDYVLRLTISKILSKFAGDTAVCPVAFMDDYLIAFGTEYVFKSTQQWKDAEAWGLTAARGLDAAIRMDRKKGALEIQAVPFEPVSGEVVRTPNPYDPFDGRQTIR